MHYWTVGHVTTGHPLTTDRAYQWHSGERIKYMWRQGWGGGGGCCLQFGLLLTQARMTPSSPTSHILGLGLRGTRAVFSFCISMGTSLQWAAESTGSWSKKQTKLSSSSPPRSCRSLRAQEQPGYGQVTVLCHTCNWFAFSGIPAGKLCSRNKNLRILKAG